MTTVPAVDPDTTAPISSPVSPISPIEDPEEEIRRAHEDDEKRAEREEIKRTQSYATDASVLTRTTTRQSVPAAKKPWYKTPNPLRWGAIPPIPEKRQPSREYTASWWSLLTFQWMAPLMNVRPPSLRVLSTGLPTQWHC